MPRDLVLKDKPRLWKDFLDQKAVKNFSEQIALVYPAFEKEKYLQSVLADSFFKLELKQRIDKIAVTLKEFLPDNYEKAVRILIDAAPRVPMFENWALTTYVQRFGLSHLEISIMALEELTKHGTSEFAIRPYMINHTQKMLPVLSRWTKSKNEHVRRLAAEGSRPRGVWTAHIESFKKNPKPVIKILEPLKADNSLYVRKAVANNLNDISKDHPELVIETCAQWLESNHQHTDWIVKRGLRTLIKKGHPQALKLLGVNHKTDIKIKSFTVKPAKIKIGGAVTMSLELKSNSSKKQKLVIDYTVHFVKNKGTTSRKTFKWAEKSIGPRGSLTLSKKHSFRNLSTRKHYPGKHLIEVLVNGKVAAKKSVMLK